MNERDSEIICSLMRDEGYQPASVPEEADLIIYNTCSVRKHAEDRVWGQIAQIKAKGTGKGRGKEKRIIGLVGCMGKAYGKDIFERLPHVDFVCGPANIYDIPDLVDKITQGKKHLVSIDNEKRPLSNKDGHSHGEIRAFVNIGAGCNNFCSYCIVPFVRGREVSRKANDIIDEVKQLVDNGTKEITLLGQNVNSYSTDKDFIGLLKDINKIEDLLRIRFMTSHPKDASRDLFKAMRDLDKVCEHLHLPLQSGSDRILTSMNRNYTSSHYLKLTESFKKLMPEATISTDIIVGFPSETDKDFMDTYLLMKEIAFSSSFIFKYSPRPFTKAADLEDDVRKEIKEERNQVLLNLQNEMTTKKHEALVGDIQQSLGIRGAKRIPQTSIDKNSFYIKGRTRGNSQVVYKADKSLLGREAFVKIKDVEQNTLIGELA